MARSLKVAAHRAAGSRRRRPRQPGLRHDDARDRGCRERRGVPARRHRDRRRHRRRDRDHPRSEPRLCRRPDRQPAAHHRPAVIDELRPRVSPSSSSARCRRRPARQRPRQLRPRHRSGLRPPGRGRSSAIAFLNGPIDTTPGDARLRRLPARHDGAAGRPDERAIVSGADFTADAGEKAARTRSPATQPDAIICANDLLAIGAMRALRAAGRTVPGDVAVVGMDNTELAELTTPTLTSVCLGSAERGSRSRRPCCSTGSATRTVRRSRVTVQPRLVERASSDAVAHAAARTKRGAR